MVQGSSRDIECEIFGWWPDGVAMGGRWLSLPKGHAGWFFRCREDHAAHEARAGCGFCFMHDPLQMFFDGVFAEIHSSGDFFVGKSELEVNDDHLFAFGQVIEPLDVCVGAFEFVLIQLFHDDEASAVSCKGFVGNTEPAKEELLTGGNTEPFQLEGFEVLGMITAHETSDEGADNGEDIFGNRTGAVFSGWEGLQLPDKCLGFAVYKQEMTRAIEEDDAGTYLFLEAR